MARIAMVLLAMGLFATGAFGGESAEFINQGIQSKGLKWKAAHNPAVEQFDDVSFGLPMDVRGWEARDSYDQRTRHGDLRSQLDWRNYEGQNFMSPVKNQGRCGSCVAFAALAQLEGQFNITVGAANYNPNFSEQYLFSNIGSCNYGSWPSSAMSSLRSDGVPDETCHPYISGRSGVDQSSGSACGDLNERGLKIRSYQSVSSSQVKAALQNGPVSTTMSVYEDFMFYSSGIYQYSSGDYLGGHAVTIVGYNDDEGYFIVKNSWGEDWGEGGYFRIAYNDRSGVGRSNNYSVTIDLPADLVKVASPEEFSAAQNSFAIQAADMNGAAVGAGDLAYKLTNEFGDSVSGSIDPARMATQVDVSNLPNGVYEVELNSVEGDRRMGATWFQRVVVANTEADVDLILEPEFDPTGPVSGRVYFLVKTAGSLPLTKVDMLFKAADGSVRTVVLEDTGDLAKLGWRTGMYPNGEYQVQAVGYLGSLQTFSSEEITVTVSN